MKNKQITSFHIKNMYCQRCIIAVENIFTNANFQINSIQLGIVNALHPNLESALEQVAEALRDMGFELVITREQILANKIKTEIIKTVHHFEEVPKVNIAEHLCKTLDAPYKKMSQTFKGQQNMTIEKFFILQKIERAKALLQYDELSIKEIAYKLGYSSLQHLSNQFKSETGISPRMYKVTGVNTRVALGKVGA